MVRIIYNGTVLDTLNVDTELTLQVNNYLDIQPGKPFKSGEITLPDTIVNRNALSTLFDADGSIVDRTVENVVYDNGIVSLSGSLVVIGGNRHNITAVFSSGNSIVWVDFGDKTLRDLDWSAYNHTLNKTTIDAADAGTLNALCRYDLCDRGKFIDETVLDGTTARIVTPARVNHIERYPIFNIAEMLKFVFKQYHLKTNFIIDSWFTSLYQLFNQSTDIRNSKEWLNDALFKTIGSAGATFENLAPIMREWTAFDIAATITLADTVDDSFDNGANFDPTTKKYTIPETGTYRFKMIVTDGTVIFTQGGGTVGLAYTLTGTGDPRIYCKIVSGEKGIIGFIDTTEITGTSGNFNVTCDTGYIELNAGDTVDCAYGTKGTYYIDSPGTKFQCSLACKDVQFLNDVSRYYGYGSTVEIKNLMPDYKVNDWLKRVFNHFGIVSQYSSETNIVRLTVQADYTTYDLTTFLDPTTGENECTENFTYELQFKKDGADKYSEWWYEQNDTQTGAYKSRDNGQDKRIFYSDFSNTVMQIPYRIKGTMDAPLIPVLWQSVPTRTRVMDFRGADYVPAYRTTFNDRILKYTGSNARTYPFAYHLPHAAGNRISGHVVENRAFQLFTSAGITFDNDFFLRLHKYNFERICNGYILSIQGTLPPSYLNALINCTDDRHMAMPVFIGLEPFVGNYTIQEITTNGILTQLTLIKNG